jgi:hypothetical protein
LFSKSDAVDVGGMKNEDATPRGCVIYDIQVGSTQRIGLEYFFENVCSLLRRFMNGRENDEPQRRETGASFARRIAVLF